MTPSSCPGALAASYARQLTAELVPQFPGGIRWTATGLLVEAHPNCSGLVVAPSSWQSPESENLESNVCGMVGMVGASGALLASLLTRFPRALRGRDVALDTSQIVPAPGRASATPEWQGFVRLPDGWLGVAVIGDAAHQLLSHPNIRTAVRSRSLSSAAAYLQMLGVAAMPAWAGDVRRQSGSPGDAMSFSPMAPGHQRRHRPPLTLTKESPLTAVLDGVVVADLGRLVSAPLAASVLEELGARVIRVRPPANSGPAVLDERRLDIKEPDDLAEMREIVRGSDLAIENFRPRAWQQLQAVLGGTGHLQHLALRGFPSTSSCRNWKLYGYLVEGALGVGSVPAGRLRAVQAPQPPVWDSVVGVVGAAAAVTLLGRKHTSEAEVSLVGAARRLRHAVRIDQLAS
jgi:hypothetical protein